jgi:hypothetical protein
VRKIHAFWDDRFSQGSAHNRMCQHDRPRAPRRNGAARMTRRSPSGLVAKRPLTPIAVAMLLLACPPLAAESQTPSRALAEFAGPPHPTHPTHPNKPAANSIEIVVKFKDEAKAKDIINLFWKDPQAATAKFEHFRLGRSDMTGATLLRVTYSDELVLAFPCNAPSAAGCQNVAREVAARLLSSPDISYAEPDMTFGAQSR